MTRPRCFCIEAVVDGVRWYVACFASGMLNMLTAPELTLVFLGIVASLGTALVWMFWEMERASSKPRRNGGRRG